MQNLLKFWVTSLFKHEKQAFSAADGAFSVFLGAAAAFFFNFAVTAVQTAQFSLNNFISMVFIYPAIVLGIAVLFVAMVRMASSIYGGKGDFVREWQAITPVLGSLIFVIGIFLTVWMSLFGVLWSAAVGALPAGTAGYLMLMGRVQTIFLLIGAFCGGFLLFFAYLYGAVQGYWLENLRAVENVDIHKLNRLLWLGKGLTLLVLGIIASVIAGMWVSQIISEILAAGGQAAA